MNIFDTEKSIKNEQKKRVCPVERAGGLDNVFRKWLQNPWEILSPFVSEGMTVLDIGCGPGFFTLTLAELVGPSGRVIAADLQSGMLDKLRAKIQGTELEKRIILHQCRKESMGLSDRFDFALAFYMVHEMPDPQTFFNEIAKNLTNGGVLLLVEPPFHVSRADFAKTLQIAKDSGFALENGPKIFLSRTAMLRNRRT